MTDEKQNEERWFLIEHEKCKSILTIKGDKYLNATGSEAFHIYCPNCPDNAKINHETLQNFFKAYKTFTNSLKRAGFTIREIQPGYLDAIKDLRKLLVKS